MAGLPGNAVRMERLCNETAVHTTPLRDRLQRRLTAEIEAAQLALSALTTAPGESKELQSARMELHLTERALRDLEAIRKEAAEVAARHSSSGFIRRVFLGKMGKSEDKKIANSQLLAIAIKQNKTEIVRKRIRTLETDHRSRVSNHYVDFHKRRSDLEVLLGRLSSAKAALEERRDWKPSFAQLMRHVDGSSKSGDAALVSEMVDGDYTASENQWGVGIIKLMP